MSFKDVSDIWGTQSLKGYSNGAAYADLDNDGNLDLIINCLNAPALILKIILRRRILFQFRFKVMVLIQWVLVVRLIYLRVQMQYQQLMAVRGFMSSSTYQLHFG
jgi:hypothetical protein